MNADLGNIPVAAGGTSERKQAGFPNKPVDFEAPVREIVTVCALDFE
jgi:hypothetical protein